MFDIWDKVVHRVSGWIGVITEKHEGKKYPYMIIWNGRSHAHAHSDLYLMPADYF